MQIEIFTTCDYAFDEGEKLNILQIYNYAAAMNVPCLHPHLIVVCRLRFESTDEDEYTTGVRIINEDGKVLRAVTNGKIKNLSPLDQTHVYNFIVRFEKILFERFGNYSVDLLVDGNVTHSIPFYVNKVATTSK